MVQHLFQNKVIELSELISLCNRAGVSQPLSSMENNRPYLLAKWNACTAKLHREQNASTKNVLPHSNSEYPTNRKVIVDYKTLAANDS